MTSDRSDTPAALAKRSAPEPLKTALHAHLRSIVDKPISTRMLLELGQAASLASQLERRPSPRSRRRTRAG